MKYAHIVSSVVNDTVQVDPFSIFSPDYAEQFVQAPDGIELGWLFSGGSFTPPPAPSRVAVVAAKWSAVKAERDRRKWLGVKVSANWFHSDDSSRIQQLALVMLGANIPAGLQWKTLTRTGSVFVSMTQALAGSIFQSTLQSDTAVFSAAEMHRVAIEASATPESYNILIGWPASFEDSV